MAEKGKQKKVEARDVLRKELAKMLMEAKGLETIGRNKEGLVIRDGEQDLVVRVIQKKSKVEQADIVETFTLADLEVDGEDGEETQEEGEQEATG